GARMRKVTTTMSLPNPFTDTSLIDAGCEAVTVDTDVHVWDLGLMMWRLKGDPLTVTAPDDANASGSVGSYLVWGPSTTGFFDALASGDTPPRELLQQEP